VHGAVELELAAASALSRPRAGSSLASGVRTSSTPGTRASAGSQAWSARSPSGASTGAGVSTLICSVEAPLVLAPFRDRASRASS
jgi:hypothetical protein